MTTAIYAQHNRQVKPKKNSYLVIGLEENEAAQVTVKNTSLRVISLLDEKTNEPVLQINAPKDVSVTKDRSTILRLYKAPINVLKMDESATIKVDNVRFKVFLKKDARFGSVRVAFEAPREVKIVREKVLHRQQQKLAS